MIFIKDGVEVSEIVSNELEHFSQTCSWPLVFIFQEGQYWLGSNKQGEKPIGIEIDQELERHLRYFKTHSLQKELLSKAVGVRAGKRPKILDLTAGLLGDSLLFLAMGCEVVAVERHPVVSFLIQSALKRASHQLTQNLKFYALDAKSIIKEMGEDDVIFYDPMFEDANLKSGAKKEMRIFRELIGIDQDSSQVLEMLLNQRVSRVVVKRPRLSQYLARKPDVEFVGKATRYDVYFPKTMAQLNQIS
jgi:16S rRNA (guanine1516-N2)-methyltransferase